MKKILLLSETTPNFRKAWREWGYSPWVLEAGEDYTKLAEESLERCLIEYRQMGVSHVFTFDFVPVLAKCCVGLRLRYVSWVVDCPHNTLWSRYARSEYCYIFAFDYQQYLMLKGRGIRNSFYLPLCTDVDGFRQTLTARQEESLKYTADISFVGNLYNDADHSLYDQICYLPPYVRGYLDALMETQHRIWGADLLSEGITEEIWRQIRSYVRIELGNDYEDGIYESMFANMLGQKMAQLERREVCSYLAGHYDFVLYTGSDTSFEPQIRNRGKVEYLSQMPLVFHQSKININITSRSITSGIPLRVMDVLGCEGFLLTNYQPEIAQYFEEGKELVVYEDFQDLYRKIDYYLVHEQERKEIAYAGYCKVREQFCYRQGVEVITKVLAGGKWPDKTMGG